jgi:hypothetical protein
MPYADQTEQKREIVYDNLKIGKIENEVVSGINLSKLFSVYGP